MDAATTPDPQDILGMSDEEILNMNGPTGEGVVEVDPSDETVAAGEGPGVGSPVGSEDTTSTESQAEADAAPEEPAGTAGDDGGAADGQPADTEPKPEDKEAAKPEGEAADGAGDKPKEDEKPKPAEGVPTDPEQLTAFYQKIMAPFKANGKMVQARTPEEVISLMQMGANYTRKLQELQPHRKMLLMLQNNDLLSEEKLSFLIDLDRKDPEAIKKLVKDSGIDPMDIDVSQDPAYQAGNHQVSDEAVVFKEAVEELVAQDNGRETLSEINDHWDQTSKEAIWKSPEIMAVIHEQRENGIYPVIVAEMDRLKTMGQLPANTPFLQAYKMVGDELVKANGFAHLGVTSNAPTDNSGAPAVAPAGNAQEPAAVAVRVAAPKSPVANDDKATAASPTRSSSRKAEPFVNPLAMSDDEFLSSMKDRL